MIGDDELLARVCRALCARVRLASAWTLKGPTPLAIAVRDGRSPLSHGEQVMLRVAWSMWSGEGGLTLAELVQVLDVEHTRVVFDLVLAAMTDGRAVEAWLARNELDSLQARAERPASSAALCLEAGCDVLQVAPVGRRTSEGEEARTYAAMAPRGGA